MNYIGSKYKLSSFIHKSITSVVGNDLSDKVFCDLFAGTGAIGRVFKKQVRQVISNDMQYYSYVLNKNYIENHQPINYETHIAILNNLTGEEGFIYREYAEGGSGGRNYFKAANGRRIDAIRRKIAEWKQEGSISEEQYYFLLASLLESADKVANTASVYGAFLKHIKVSAQKDLVVEPALFAVNTNEHKVYNEDSNQLIRRISGDILYLDPPYNAREYGANYHLLNTIARYEPFTPKGKTGLPPYNKSRYCKKSEVMRAFEELLYHAEFKYIFLSYNNEGLMPCELIRETMEKYGRYDLLQTDYQRFKADKEENRNHKASSTVEYLHVLEL
ncbi:adenine-specific DNA-methyltransferase [Capnocytophaga haemolytica]|uniref:site-specific DNA-methyltransferase (adenine-specific) n=1 Tax=Capnocytophaga haemolytica TaxID=45243 RepID=A0AAX2GX69_9FLAO|nr:DNA adenine methylase [Capnocytophaga haemolytica]AMD84669.1 modification methylase [Capnocytophaga haemolytica]SFO21325.1 adenine-specific DNA-methyltransferase [Capnocytophaga haemolytica]SNV08544.1 Modification methylase FokI [Capnocytophaga haemolytica]